ncbi:zinc/iron regulated transporter-related protein 48C isoform X2 [Lycorma delicatula]|uniref:zinc/iron regulated transporter-related protein 48C isoform X2 n=1 Tax=Lycorma delicatula TaxID=130591 RepID=UPI003F5148C7
MLPQFGPITQTVLGTLFTWGLTAAGAGLVVIIHGKQRKLLDTSLGFAAGVMTAASYWSLLAPAIEMAEESSFYGEKGEYAFIPVSLGFLFGCLFVFSTDLIISMYGLESTRMLLADNKHKSHIKYHKKSDVDSESFDEGANCLLSVETNIDCYRAEFNPMKRRKTNALTDGNLQQTFNNSVKNVDLGNNVDARKQWKRILLLLIAITVHNIPEGIVVGVGFAAVGTSPSATFQNARNLAIGIGIQNFPEGLAVSLPLHAAGFSTWKSFWYGQLSGMVEPIFGVLGAIAVTLAKPLLPYALAFAAGAMIYVVIDDIVPEAHASIIQIII